MLNLFIGILSEKLSEILENREKNEYKELCALIYMLENLKLWGLLQKDKHDVLVYAT